MFDELLCRSYIFITKNIYRISEGGNISNFRNKLRGHSTTTWTNFDHLPPSIECTIVCILHNTQYLLFVHVTKHRLSTDHLPSSFFHMVKERPLNKELRHNLWVSLALFCQQDKMITSTKPAPNCLKILSALTFVLHNLVSNSKTARGVSRFFR